ncbi:MAG: hypothetical protein BGO16_00140 [Nitrobacter sp. 62-23]|nr:MAG: hypothetical protein BGO16_00140 [Nitrobacter sp. 62-23]
MVSRLILFPFQHDDVAAPEVDVNGCEAAEDLMVAAVVVVIDERCDLPFKITPTGISFPGMRFFRVWCHRSILP